MPLPDSVFAGSRRSVRGLLRRLTPQPPAPPPTPPLSEPVPVVSTGTDAATRRYWAQSAGAPAMLVEAPTAAAESEARPSARERLSALLREHEHGTAGVSRPRGNPAFSEALFVELMRARQYRRAFEQLSSDCRRLWGSAEAFAAAQGSGMRRLLGVRVKAVRYLPEWTDPQTGSRHQQVAELDVEYTLDGGDRPSVLQRVVHLVPDGGKWRSLCYPA